MPRKPGEPKIKWPQDYQWLHEYLLAKPGAVLEYKESWNSMLYRVGGKIFAILLRDNQKRLLVNMKCEPMISMEFRENLKGVEAGWHMNKLHWISLVLKARAPEDAVKELADMSYALVKAGLPLKIRQQCEEADKA